MIRLESITDDTYEPFTNGASPNPQYPQPIEVSGESYNLLENTANPKEVYGVKFVVNDDKTIVANGQATDTVAVAIPIEKSFDYDVIISGCPSIGTATTYSINIKLDGSWGQSEYGSGYLVPKGKVINQINLAVYKGYTAENSLEKQSKILPQVQISLFAHCDLMESCWGVPSPNPAIMKKREAT